MRSLGTKIRRKEIRPEQAGTSAIDWWSLPPRHLSDRFQGLPNAGERLGEVVDYWSNFARLDAHECVDPWHVLAVDRTTGHLVGTVRMLVSHDRNRELVPQDILQFGSTQVSDPRSRSLHYRALKQFIQSATPGPIVYVGEFYIAQRFRRTRLCLELGLSAHALGAIHGWCHGITFATTEANADKLFLRMGGYELSVDGAPLPVFYCSNHQQTGRLLGLEIYRCERPSSKKIISTIEAALLARRTDPFINRA